MLLTSSATAVHTGASTVVEQLKEIHIISQASATGHGARPILCVVDCTVPQRTGSRVPGLMICQDCYRYLESTQ